MTKKAKTQPNFECKTHEVAAFFDVSDVTIGDWVKKGCPKLKYGVFNLQDVFRWWFDNIAASKVEEADTDIKDVKIEYWKAKAEGERIKVELAKGALVKTSEIASAWASRVTEVTAGLSGLIDRLPPLLIGKSRQEVRDILYDEIWQLRDRYAREGKHSPKN